MGKRIKVVHFVEQTGYGGTEKMMYILCKYLNKEKFEVFAAFPDNHPSFGNARKHMFYKILDKDHVFEFPYGDKKSFEKFIVDKQIHILHAHRDGLPTWPLSYGSVDVPIRIETNVFSNYDPCPWIDRTYFMSVNMQEIAAYRNGFPDPHGKRFRVMYAPVETPASQDNMRKELGISNDTVVFGRMGSAWSWSPMIVEAYKRVENKNNLLLVLMPAPQWKEAAKQLGIKNIIYLEQPLIEDELISKFYNTLDVQVHAKNEGECCPGSIVEGMRHGLPVITHISPNNNGQVEVVNKSGFITQFNDVDSYATIMRKLQENKPLRLAYGMRAKQHAIDLFDAQLIVDQLERDYIEIFKDKNLYL